MQHTQTRQVSEDSRPPPSPSPPRPRPRNRAPRMDSSISVHNPPATRALVPLALRGQHEQTFAASLLQTQIWGEQALPWSRSWGAYGGQRNLPAELVAWFAPSHGKISAQPPKMLWRPDSYPQTFSNCVYPAAERPIAHTFGTRRSEVRCQEVAVDALGQC